MINEITKQFVMQVDEAHKEVIKKLASFAGINADSLNHQNVVETKGEMRQRGYEIITRSENERTYYDLLHKGKKIVTGEVWYEIGIDLDNNKGTATVKHKLTPHNA